MKEKIKILQIIHIAIVIGVLLAYFFLGNLSSLKQIKLPKIDTNSMVYIAIPIMAYILSNFLFKDALKKIDSKLPLEKKMAPYQTASIIRWAILEGGAFVILFVKPDFILFGLVLVVYLFLLRPTASVIESDLNKYVTQ